MRVTGVLVVLGFSNDALSSHSMSHFWSLRFGRVSSETLINLRFPQDQLLGVILLVNTPQVVLSSFYLTINALLTKMLLADE